MKIKGKKIAGPNIEIIAIPRGDGEDIIFKAQAILDMEPFFKAMPVPQAPKVRTKDGVSENPEDPDYKKALMEWAGKKTAWMILKSLEVTPDLIWEQAKLEDPNTWHLYIKELNESGFSDIEISRIINGVMSANCLDERKMEEARKRFLVLEAAQVAALSSPMGELVSMPFGVPVNASG